MALSDDAIRRICEQMARYPQARSALMPALYIAQDECGGWIPTEAVDQIADVMSLEAGDVQATMSFYTMYYKRPKGRYLLEICQNVACTLLGAQQLIDHLQQQLGIAPGETTEDGLFTLRLAECMASCGGAPAVQVNSLYHEHMTVEKLDALLDQLRAAATNGEGA